MPPQKPPPLPSSLAPLFDMYNAYIHPLLPSPLQSLSSIISSFTTSIASAASNGDIISLAAFLLVFYLTFKIADYIRRSVIGWVVFVVKIAVVLGMVNAVVYVNRYGVQKSMADAEWIFGILWGMVEQKVAGVGDSVDNRTGGYGSGYGSAGSSWRDSYGGGRQQVPVGRGRAKAKSGFSWT